MTLLDRRRQAFRADLADARLKGQVDAARFVTGHPRVVAAAIADLRRAPGGDQSLDTQLLMGQEVIVFDEAPGYDGAPWAWCQAKEDAYVGYVPCAALNAPQSVPSRLTHQVIAPRTFLFPKADLKLPPLDQLSMGSKLSVVDEINVRGTLFACLASGRAVPANHLAPIGQGAPIGALAPIDQGAPIRAPVGAPIRALRANYVDVALRFVGTPYLWGGTTGFGIDCSGLVQQSLRVVGIPAPRDSDMQEAEIGERLDGEIDRLIDDRALQRGDLIFWQGHVGILIDSDQLLHANAHHMATAVEPLASTLDRFQASGLPVRAVKRLAAPALLGSF